MLQTFPRQLAFVGYESQGLGYHHPFILQIIKQISIINKYWHCNSTTGCLIRNLWENTVQISGMRGNSSKWNWKKINEYIPKKWISQLMEQSQSIQLYIKLPIKEDKKWANNRPIMEVLHSNALLNLRILNKIRMSL